MRRAGRRKKNQWRPRRIGETIVERYQLVEKLGEGGMAEVFHATDLSSGRSVARKIRPPDIAHNPEAVERARREGELLSTLANPAIVQVETFGELEDGTIYLVMELLEGETLGDRVRRGIIDHVELAPIIAGTCAGLHAAHERGIVHRDLKPDNIFLCPTDHGLQVKLLDFGISKLLGCDRLTKTGEILGTPRYMSPEQLGAESDIDGRVDVYALGVIAYQALAGRPPFLAATPTDLIVAIVNGKVEPLRSVQMTVPEAVAGVVMRALHRDREARFESVRAMADAYIEAVGGVSTVKAHQRRGQATRVFGGDPKPEHADDGRARALPLGTFAGRGDPGAGSAERRAVTGDLEPPSSTASRARTYPETRETAVEDFLEPEATAPVKRTAQMSAHDAQSVLDRSRLGMDVVPPAETGAGVEPASPPAKRGSRVALVAGALLAGAVTALVAIVLLELWLASSAPEVDAQGTVGDVSEVEGAATRDEASATVATTRADVDAGAGSTASPVADPVVAPPPVASVRNEEATVSSGTTPSVPAARGARSSDQRGRRRSSARAERSGAREQGASALEILERARVAQRQGDSARCVELLDQALAAGAPAIALRRRGDCYAALGRRDEAVRDYRRFCRLVPDNPSIGEVRGLLSSWGQSCP